MGSLCFLYPCNIIARIAERTAAVRMIKQAKTPLSLNRGHHPKAWQTAVPVRGRSSPNLLHTTHLITQIRSQSPELPPSLKRWDHLCNPISVPVKMDSCRRVKAALLGTSIVLSYWSELGSMGAWKLPIQTKTKQSFVHPTCHFKLEVFYITHHALTTSVNSTPLWLLKFICMLSLIFPCSVKPFCTQTPLAAVGNLPAKDANKQSSNKYWAYSRSVSAGTDRNVSQVHGCRYICLAWIYFKCTTVELVLISLNKVIFCLATKHTSFISMNTQPQKLMKAPICCVLTALKCGSGCTNGLFVGLGSVLASYYTKCICFLLVAH